MDADEASVDVGLQGVCNDGVSVSIPSKHLYNV